MNLTEAKLKQMILDEMKSNLSPKETAELQQAIREVEVLVDQYLKVESDLDGLYLVYDELKPHMSNIDSEIGKHEQELSRLKAELMPYATKHHVYFHNNSVDPVALLDRMRMKFRRKSL